MESTVSTFTHAVQHYKHRYSLHRGAHNNVMYTLCYQGLMISIEVIFMLPLLVEIISGGSY